MTKYDKEYQHRQFIKHHGDLDPSQLYNDTLDLSDRKPKRNFYGNEKSNSKDFDFGSFMIEDPEEIQMQPRFDEIKIEFYREQFMVFLMDVVHVSA